MSPLRRRIAFCIAAVPVLSVWTSVRAAGARVTLYKDANCGCCSKWADHLRRNGFAVVSHDTPDLAAIKAKYRVPPPLAACHTAVVDGYTIEGHVPADVVRRLLKERPAGVVGLAVPGMPLGSPGMESSTPQPYEILAFDARGGSRAFDRR
jgi:hypothetical protein